MKRFWNKVEKTNYCWNWTAGLRNGYGVFKFEGKTYDTNRFVWFLTYKKWPEKWALHKCNNRKCVNPNHLYDGTPRDNVKDTIRNGNFHYALKLKKGHISFNRKLTFEQAQAIIKEYSETEISMRKIGEKYAVDQRVVRLILKGETYKR